MEFTNEIFFNKPLTAESTVILTYIGKLYREHSKDVSIVFGYGDNWEETESLPMKETENGFEVTLTIKNYDKFNFCFSNSFNIWDNNFGANYIAPIGPKQEEIKQEENQDNDNTPKADGLGDNQEEASSPAPTQENEEQPEEETQEQQEQDETEANTAEFESSEPSSDIEKAFASLLDSILDDTNNNNETIDISDLSGFGLQSVDEIKEEDMINCDSIFAELFEELTVDNNDNKQEINVQKEAEVTNYENYDAQELDNLMDNLLVSISDNSETADLSTPVQEIKSENIENAGLPALQQKEDWVDKIINVSYKFSKTVTTAFKKFGLLVKEKVLGFSKQ